MVHIHNQAHVVYKEVQRPRQPLWWLLVLPIAAWMWYGFIQQVMLGVPFGSKPAPDAVMVALWLIFGMAFPIVLLGWFKLIVEVRDDALYIRFSPFHRRYRQFPHTDIRHYEAVDYNALSRFGGWGIRVNLQGETAYIMNGGQGVALTVKNQTVVIGTQQPEQLIKALDSVNRSC